MNKTNSDIINITSIIISILALVLAFTVNSYIAIGMSCFSLGFAICNLWHAL